MTPVFLDTAGLIAVWERADQGHATAAEAFRLLPRSHAPLLNERLAA